MNVTVPQEMIHTVCNALRDAKRGLKWKLEVSIPNGKAAKDKEEVFRAQLAEVEAALKVFEALEF